MRDISMERVNTVRQEILDIIKSPTLTHEQKMVCMAGKADSLLEVMDLPEGLDELLNAPIETQCICDLNEGHAPMRPRYIAPDYEKFLKNGSAFLQLDPPKDLFEALNALLIIYKHVPSITNYPVYLGQLDELLEPYIDTVDEKTARKLIRLFLLQVDRTILDSFSHADIGPVPTRAGLYILEAEKELEDAVPNLSLKYQEGVTDDAFMLSAIDCALHSAKPSFANHLMFRKELTDRYVNPVYQFDAGWFDASSVTLRLPVNGYEVSMSVRDWSDALNGETVTIYGTLYNFGVDQADKDTRLTILAGIEGAVLQTYDYIPMLQDAEMMLLSRQVSYVAEDYNPVMSRGGLAYLRYAYDDAQWAEYVAGQGGSLKY